MTTSVKERGVSFSPNYQGYYFLKTEFTGSNLALEGNEAGSPVKDGAAFMSDGKMTTGTMWRLEPDKLNPGWYRLKNKFQGANKSLESNEAGSSFKNGGSFMDDDKNVTGQLWRLSLVSVKDGDHLYRLQSKLHGDTCSLEGNDPVKGIKSGKSFMDKSQNVTGQLWRLIPVQ